MQILTRLNQVIAYSNYNYIPIGNTAVCAKTKECYDDVLITEVDCVPTDINKYEYYYIDGKFIKGYPKTIVDSTLSETSKNPVQNRVVTSELNKTVKKIDWDNTNNNYVYANKKNEEGVIKFTPYDDFTVAASGIPGYKNGKIKVQSPSDDYDAANKKYVNSKFNGAAKGVAFETFGHMVGQLTKSYAQEQGAVYTVGQNIYIKALNFPDLWVYAVADTFATYNKGAATFLEELNSSNPPHVGWYILSALETQKVDLEPYAEKENTYTKAESTSVISTHIGTHNSSTSAHSDIRDKITAIENGTTKVPNANFATNAQYATTANYASVDQSKGTIEERLTSIENGTKIIYDCFSKPQTIEGENEIEITLLEPLYEKKIYKLCLSITDSGGTYVSITFPISYDVSGVTHIFMNYTYANENVYTGTLRGVRGENKIKIKAPQAKPGVDRIAIKLWGIIREG